MPNNKLDSVMEWEVEFDEITDDLKAMPFDTQMRGTKQFITKTIKAILKDVELSKEQIEQASYEMPLFIDGYNKAVAEQKRKHEKYET